MYQVQPKFAQFIVGKFMEGLQCVRFMPATVVLGAQWGDEGKGKMVDQLASEASWVARFQGGNNAGHTIVIGDRTLKLNHLPSGITYPDCQLVLGDGMVIDPWTLEKELEDWYAFGQERPEGVRLWISERAHVNLPYHRRIDGTDTKIGTTKRGIGPTYGDKIERVGVRFCDIPSRMSDPEWLAYTAERMNARLDLYGIKDTAPSDDDPVGWNTISRQASLHGEITAQSLALDLSWIWQRFGKAVAPTGIMLDMALKQGENILLEGAQGCLLDIDQGTFPFVTSSVTSRGNATHGAGIHPGHVEKTYGVVKAYTTRVGEGPFPTELYDGKGLSDSDGKHMADVGHEFGTTTGRPRRCGWLDLVVLRHAHRLNGFDGATLTKLDVLGGIPELKICIGYTINGEACHDVPADIGKLARCEPVYETVPGFEALSLEEWLDIARTAAKEGTGFQALPENARAYVEKIESLIGFPIISVGVGPDREATIERN